MKIEKSQCIILIMVMLVVVIISFGGFYWYDKSKTQTQIVELEKAIRTLQSQLYHIEPEETDLMNNNEQ